MGTKIKPEYDTIIIGAGIGGLVCGCYLARTGIRVLIVEKNNNVGGYCSSFRRGDFVFDSAVHSFGNFSEKAAIRKIFEELNMEHNIQIIRVNPSDMLKIKDMCIKIDNDIKRTQENISFYFPREKNNLARFFDYVKKAKAVESFVYLKNMTFLDLLSSYFTDKKLINILSFPLGNIGLSADAAAAFSGVMLYRDFIFDGGYYPEKGMQNLANKFAEAFEKFGGEIIKGAQVSKVLLKDKRAIGVQVNEEQVLSKYVVSNCDSYHTFFKLLNPDLLSKRFKNRIKNGLQSISSFVLYLGLNKKIENCVEKCCTLWCFDDFNINHILKIAMRGEASIPPQYFLATFPTMHEPRLSPSDKSIMTLIVGAPFKNEDFWNTNRAIMSESLLEKATKIVPGIRELVEIKTDATPQTLYRYTLNNKGAICGWASTLKQVYQDRINPISEIENLFLTGHWTTPPAGQGGVDVVIYSGKTTARLVMASIKNKKEMALI